LEKKMNKGGMIGGSCSPLANRIRLLFLIVFQVLISGAILAQQEVNGVVTDAATGEGLPGVNVVIKGTSTGAITDINGRYSIYVNDPADILVFSFVGYE